MKSGGIYKPNHVIRMQEQIKKFVNLPYEFVCYSDIDFALEGTIRKLKHDLPGWWAKMELFREKDEESFYIDLDMDINGDITDIVDRKSGFCALHNMTKSIRGIGSALMKWEGDKTFLYKGFLEAPERHMADNNRYGSPYLGDQGYIFRSVLDIEIFQDIFPNRIKPYKSSDKGDITVYYGKNKPARFS